MSLSDSGQVSTKRPEQAGFVESSHPPGIPSGLNLFPRPSGWKEGRGGGGFVYGPGVGGVVTLWGGAEGGGWVTTRQAWSGAEDVFLY